MSIASGLAAKGSKIAVSTLGHSGKTINLATPIAELTGRYPLLKSLYAGDAFKPSDTLAAVIKGLGEEPKRGIQGVLANIHAW